MQYYVPYKKTAKRSWAQINSAIAGFLFFILTLSILVCLGVSRKKNKCFDKVSYHFVFVQKNRIQTNKDEQDLVKSLGGAGIYYFHKENYLLIANVYHSSDDAKEIKNGMLENFENADVLTLEAPAINRKTQNIIKDNLSYYKFFKYLQMAIQNFEVLNMNYLSGEITQGKLMSELISKKLELETIVNEFENPQKEDLFENIKTYANMFLIHFDNFFNEFYQSTKKQSLVCSLCVNFALTKVDLFDNL